MMMVRSITFVDFRDPHINSGESCLLRVLYTNTNIKGFFRKMLAIQIPYFVLSRKYGICSESDHVLAYSSSEHLSDVDLITLLKNQAPYFAQFHLIYYNHRPLTHSKWVNILRSSGFFVSEVQRLAEYDRYGGNLDQYLKVEQGAEIH